MSQEQLASMQALRASLVAQRDEMTQDIEALDRIIKRLKNSIAPVLFSPNRMAISYAGMTTGDAIEAYLRACGVPKTTNEVAEALKAGGFETIAENFYSNVYSVMRRDERFMLEDKKWRLAGA